MRVSRIPLPAPLRSTPVTALRHYYERSDSCAGGSSAPRSMNTVLTPAQVSLRPVPRRCHHSVSTHRTCPAVPFARYPSGATASCVTAGSDFAGPTRAHRSRPAVSSSSPTDWSLTSDCSPPRLATTQLPLVTGRRASAWRGLAPLCRGTIAGARGPALRAARDRVELRR